MTRRTPGQAKARAGHDSVATKETEAALRDEISKLPDEGFVAMPAEELNARFRGLGGQPPLNAWKNRHYTVQLFTAGDFLRLSVQRAGANLFIRPKHRDHRPISWDDLMGLKADLGYGEVDAVEVYPAAADKVNVADMRHLFLVPPEMVPFAWRNKGSQHATNKASPQEVRLQKLTRKYNDRGLRPALDFSVTEEGHLAVGVRHTTAAPPLAHVSTPFEELEDTDIDMLVERALAMFCKAIYQWLVQMSVTCPLCGGEVSESKLTYADGRRVFRCGACHFSRAVEEPDHFSRIHEGGPDHVAN